MWHLGPPAAPAEEPISLDEARAQACIEHYDDDVLIATYIAAARDYVEAYTGVLVAKRSVALQADGFEDFVRLPLAPLRSVTSITYLDPAGQAQTVPASDYELRVCGLDVSLVPKDTWPVSRAGAPVTLVVEAGYDDLPPAIRHALLLLVSSSIAKREDAAALGRGTVDNLLANFRFYG